MDLSLSLPSRNCVIKEEDENTCRTEPDCKHKVVIKDKLPPPKESLLLRLFESKLLDASIAITHLYKSKEPGVQSYIGKATCNTLYTKVIKPNYYPPGGCFTKMLSALRVVLKVKIYKI